MIPKLVVYLHCENELNSFILFLKVFICCCRVGDKNVHFKFHISTYSILVSYPY